MIVVLSIHSRPRDGKGKRVEFICCSYSFPALAPSASSLQVNASRLQWEPTAAVCPTVAVILARRDWFKSTAVSSYLTINLAVTKICQPKRTETDVSRSMPALRAAGDGQEGSSASASLLASQEISYALLWSCMSHSFLLFSVQDSDLPPGTGGHRFSALCYFIKYLFWFSSVKGHSSWPRSASELMMVEFFFPPSSLAYPRDSNTPPPLARARQDWRHYVWLSGLLFEGTFETFT